MQRLPPTEPVNMLRALSVVVLIALHSFAGCNRSATGVAVNGHAKYLGESVAKGLITFFPSTGRAVSAPLNQDGMYTTSLEPGEYTVIVSQGVEVPAGYKEGDRVPTPKISLPPQYSIRAKSTLKAIVRPDQSESIDFDLK